ncbi:hypothetical protein FHT29_005818 [Rhizobium sp. SG741]|nr:hypothetical protein [Rhizobium sp. SG741]
MNLVIAHQSQQSQSGCVATFKRSSLDLFYEELVRIAGYHPRQQLLKSSGGIVVDEVRYPHSKVMGIRQSLDNDLTGSAKLDGVFDQLIRKIAYVMPYGLVVAFGRPKAERYRFCDKVRGYS